jgi:predicted Zn-dependent protease
MATREHLALVSLLCACACGPQLTNPLNPFSPPTGRDLEARERELGARFDTELRNRVHVVRDPVVSGFLAELGESLVREIEPQPFAYHFRVIEDGRENAFAIPGGYVYLHSGTLLAAQDVGELAGILGHEIAHVRHHHSARMQQRAQLPDLVTGLVGIGASIAASDASPAIAALAVNQAIQLRFSRDLESEADRVGAIFVSRAGYAADAILPFFERVLAERPRDADASELPPYLFTHPEVESRIASVRAAAAALPPARAPDAALAEEFPRVQERLRAILALGRDPLPARPAQPDPAVDPLLERANADANSGEPDRALLLLARAESTAPRDPRIPLSIGQLLVRVGRPDQAIAPLRRAAELDDTTAQIHLALGQAYRAAGHRHRAAHALECALERAGSTGPLRERALLELEKVDFPIVEETGFGERPWSSRGESAAASLPRFSRDEARVRFWLRLGSHFAKRAKDVELRWFDPDGARAAGAALRVPSRGVAEGAIERGSEAFAAGIWRVEGWLDAERIAERRFELR